MIILLFPLQGFCMSDQEAFNLLMQNSTNVKMPIHVYVAPMNENKEWDYGPFQGIPLPFASYSYFKKYYGQLENAERPEELFATYQFSQGNRWHFFLLRVPGMYSIDQIDLWIYDKEKKQWLSPFKVAEEWGDAGEAIEVQGWITDINKDGSLNIVRRTLEIDTHLYDSKPRTTRKYKNEVFVWAEDHFKDVSKEYANKLKLNKYRFKKSIINTIN
jgi:hypothetical protein